METTFTSEQIEILKRFQKNEITECLIYAKLAKVTKDVNNAAILEQIGKEEKKHAEILKKYTQANPKPNMNRVRRYYFISRVLGLTFGVKLMEKGEDLAQKAYDKLAAQLPELKQILHDEESHEQQLIGMIDEEKLQYAGSMVLGLNDALVELTGTLAGLSLALQNTKLIAMAGLITGIAASFSMAASDYLAQKAEEKGKNALKSASYTGIAYVITVALLITPYLIFSNYLVCLGMTLAMAILIIFGFNYYISVAKDLDFKRRFAEMSIISLSVAALSFFIGFLVKSVLGIDV